MSFTYPILALLACLSTAALASPAPLDFTGHLAESFDALPTSGTLTLPGTGTPGFQAPLPGAPGWHIARVGGSATTDLTLATSPSTTARLYAFGLADSPDRALGALASASATSAFGLALRNASPLTFQALTLRFTQEIWLTQGTSTSQPFADRLRFAWGIDPANTTPDNFLTHPALTPLPDLDALSPPSNTLTSVASSSSPDRRRLGHAPPWRQASSATLRGLHWTPGQILYLRWVDRDDAGFDAALALDDFQLTAQTGPFPAPLTLEPTAAGPLRLRWPTLPGASYQLEDSPQLQSWTPVANFPRRAADFSLYQDVPLLPGSRFFRLWETETTPADQEVYFSSPGPTGTEDDLSLERRLRDMLARTPSGASVRGAIYTWTRETMAEAFIDAAARGVDVRLIVGSDFPAVDLLRAALPGRVTTCRDTDGTPNGCQGGRINHNKFLLFSALADGSKQVTVQSSANFTETQLPLANNLVIIREDAALYAAYLKYWNDLAQQPRNPNYFRSEPGDVGTRVTFFPRASASGTTGLGDPIVEQLATIDPSAGGSIQITMAFWTSARRAIAQRLVALHQAGCRVAVVTHPTQASAEILQILRAGGIPVTLLAAIHSKYLLLDALCQGRPQRLVLTGSHNYTGPALTENDETLLQLSHPRLYDAFLADWRRLQAHPLGL